MTRRSSPYRRPPTESRRPDIWRTCPWYRHVVTERDWPHRRDVPEPIWAESAVRWWTRLAAQIKPLAWRAAMGVPGRPHMPMSVRHAGSVQDPYTTSMDANLQPLSHRGSQGRGCPPCRVTLINYETLEWHWCSAGQWDCISGR